MTSPSSVRAHPSKEDRDAMLGWGMDEDANASFDRLAEYLAQRFGGY